MLHVMTSSTPRENYTNGAAEEAGEGKRRPDATDNREESRKVGFEPGRDSSRQGGEDGQSDGRLDKPA